MKRFAVAFIGFSVLLSGEVPNCNLAPGWQQAGPSRSYEGESLYEYMNGNSEGYLIYGFKKMNGVTCKKGEDTVHIDVSDMGDAESAYGIFCANRDFRAPIERLGTGGQVGQRKATIAKDRFYLELAAEPEKDHTASLRELAAALEKVVPGSTAVPAAIQWFPADNLQPGWPRLVPQSVLGIRILKRGYVAQYQDGLKAFLVPEASAEAAQATAEKLKARLGETSAAEIADSGFAGSDKYLGRMVVFTKGRYVGGFSAIPDGQDGLAVARGLAWKLDTK